MSHVARRMSHVAPEQPREAHAGAADEVRHACEDKPLGEVGLLPGERHDVHHAEALDAVAYVI